MDEWMDGRMNGWTDGRMDRWTDGRIEPVWEYTFGWLDCGWMDGVDGSMAEWAG